MFTSLPPNPQYVQLIDRTDAAMEQAPEPPKVPSVIELMKLHGITELKVWSRCYDFGGNILEAHTRYLGDPSGRIYLLASLIADVRILREMDVPVEFITIIVNNRFDFFRNNRVAHPDESVSRNLRAQYDQAEQEIRLAIEGALFGAVAA